MVAVMTALDCLDLSKKTAAENEKLRLEIKRLTEEAVKHGVNNSTPFSEDF